MNLLEYQGKQLFESVGLPVPKWEIAKTPEDAKRIALEIDSMVVVKAQVAAGGRGKAGGIKLAKTPEEAQEYASNILGMEIKGEVVHELILTDAVEIEREYYLAITLERSSRRPVLIFSTEGGIDIEEVADKSPDSIHKCLISPLEGLHAYQARELLFNAGVPLAEIGGVAKVILGLYQAFSKYRAHLCEINPLAISPDGKVWALDSKFVLDDDDLPAQAPSQEEAILDPIERAAHEAGLQYVRLDGNTGIIGNGAGLVMSTLDVVKLKGAEPANFLDIGGGASAEQMAKALELVLSDPNVKAVFINIFGGITRGDLVAKGLVEAVERLEINVPLVVRLTGTNAEEGRRILESKEGFLAVGGMEEGAEKIAELIRN